MMTQILHGGTIREIAAPSLETELKDNVKKKSLVIPLCVANAKLFTVHSQQLICKWKHENVFHRQWDVSLLLQAQKN